MKIVVLDVGSAQIVFTNKTPHISRASKESRTRLMNIAVDNLKAWLAGNPVNVVNA